MFRDGQCPAESLPNLSDEILDPKFQIAVHKVHLGSGDEGSYVGLKQIPMRDAQGTDHTCYLPAKPPLPESQEEDAVQDVRNPHPPPILFLWKRTKPWQFIQYSVPSCS